MTQRFCAWPVQNLINYPIFCHRFCRKEPAFTGHALFHHVLDQVRWHYTESRDFFPLKHILKNESNPTSRFTLRRGSLVLNGYPPCLINIFDAFASYEFLHAMWQMQLFLAKVTLKCSNLGVTAEYPATSKVLDTWIQSGEDHPSPINNLSVQCSLKRIRGYEVTKTPPPPLGII